MRGYARTVDGEFYLPDKLETDGGNSAADGLQGPSTTTINSELCNISEQCNSTKRDSGEKECDETNVLELFFIFFK